jgi:hypothetical protein
MLKKIYKILVQKGNSTKMSTKNCKIEERGRKEKTWKNEKSDKNRFSVYLLDLRGKIDVLKKKIVRKICKQKKFLKKKYKSNMQKEEVCLLVDRIRNSVL